MPQTLIEGNAHEGVQVVVHQLFHHGQQLQVDPCKGNWTPLGIQVEGGVRVGANDRVMFCEAGHVRQFCFGRANGELHTMNEHAPWEAMNKPWTSSPPG